MMIEDDELRNLYKISGEERLQNLKSGLLHLQNNPEDYDVLEGLCWQIHSLKGDSRILGIEKVENLSDSLEKVLGNIQSQQIVFTPQVSASLNQGLEAINLLVQEAVTGTSAQIEISQIIEQLFGSINLLPEQKENLESSSGTPSNTSLIVDAELQEIYRVTSQERLWKLREGLLHLEKHPQDQPTWEQLRREAHSLKGDSRSVGIENIEIISHSLEDIFGSFKNQKLFFSDQLNASINRTLDALDLLIEEALTGTESGVDTDQALEQLLIAFSNSPEREDELEKSEELQPNTSLIADAELRDIYQTTSQQRLDKLITCWLQLEQNPYDQDVLGQLQQESHSLTGDSRSVGLEKIESLSYSLEEVLENLKSQQIVFTPQLGKSFNQVLDVISLLIKEAVIGTTSGVEIVEIQEQLFSAIVSSPAPEIEVVSSASNYIEDAELREIYYLASQKRLQQLEAGLSRLEKYPQDQATLDKLLREAHSLKGDSRSVELKEVETLTHSIEEVIEGIKQQRVTLTAQLSDYLYQGLDAINLLVEEAVTGTPSKVEVTPVQEQLLKAVTDFQLLESGVAQVSETIAKAATPSSSSSKPDDSYQIDSIRVATEDLDALVNQAEELTVTRIRLTQALAEIEEIATLWEEWQDLHRQGQSSPSYSEEISANSNSYQERLEAKINFLRSSAQEDTTKLDLVGRELEEKIRTLRLLPLSTLFQTFPRMVRNLAKEQEKQVELLIEGEETRVDKRILEEIKDSLTHMIRNAIDHGIETPKEREKIGKSPVATICLKGYQRGSNIFIEVIDDGRGLDIEKIKQTAVKRRLYELEELESMSPSQIYNLIFAPGFSTRSFITEISGRGIGLDVVRTNVERLKGNVEIESTPWQGSTFRLQLGTSLTAANVLLFEVQGIVHALPIEFMQRTLLVSPEQIVVREGREIVEFDDQVIPVASLAELLELSNSPAYTQPTQLEKSKNNLRPTIVIKVGEEQAGFFVDRVFDTQEMIVKPQSQLLKRVRNIAGATILPTGEVCTILNSLDLLKSLDRNISSKVVKKPSNKVDRKPAVLLVEDSILVRIQEQRLLEKAGYEVIVAEDGLIGYEMLRSYDFDAVVSDVEMPHLDGLSLTAKIRQHPEYKELPIILVTTLAAEKDKQRGAKAGASAYIIKGKFNQDVLLEILERLI